ncbi:MAG TPA: hypothetical protein VMW72_07830, partial [Sedimentisphaerales bacterium]|nr:hypothetical protein [Sedimentisphaerales bacterium]
ADDLIFCLLHGYSFLNKWLIFPPDLTLYQAGVAIAFFQPSTMDGTSSSLSAIVPHKIESILYK